MKTSSDALFRLVKSMTKGEKTYFKKFTSLNNTKSPSTNYLKLFDAICKMSEYDEGTLLKKFRKETFTKNFVETKQYLKTQILRVLRNYSTDKSISFQVKEDLLNIEILMDKGIFDLAKTQIKKTLKIAQEYEMSQYIVQLNKLQFQVSKVLLDFKSVETHVTETIPEEKQLLKELGQVQHHKHRYTIMFSHWKEYGPIQEKEANANLEQYPLDTFNAAHWYLLTELNLGQTRHKAEKYYDNALSYYELFKKYPAQIDLNPFNYITSIILYTNACATSNHIEEGLLIVKEGITLMEKMDQKSKIADHFFVNHLIKLHSNQLRLYLHYGSKSLFKEHAIAFKELVLNYIDTLRSSNGFIDLATIFFSEIILEEWEAAEITYNRLTNYKMRGYRNDIEAIIRLLGIIVYYETKNIELLESAVDATYQFIRTKDFLSKFIRQFINLFKYKIISALNEREEIELLKQFRTETTTFFEEHPKEKNVLNYFDFIAWLDSKVEKTSIHEAYYKRL